MGFKPVLLAAIPFITGMDKASGASEEKSDMPEIKSKHSLVYKYLTPEIWAKYKDHKTATSGVTLEQCIACSIAFDNQHCGIYAGDGDCYTDYADLFNPIIEDYHGIPDITKHNQKTDLDPNNLQGAIGDDVPVLSTRIRVGRSIEGLGLSPGITREQRLKVEEIMKTAFEKLGEKEPDLAGEYYPLLGMDEAVRQQLVDDHFLFMSGDPNLKVGGMERDWPEGRGIFHNKDKTFLVWVNEEDQLRIISMQKGGNVNEVFARLVRGINAIEEIVKEVTGGKKFMFDDHLGFLHSCPTNLGTGMRASVHIDLKGFADDKAGLKELCDELNLQPRGTRGESSGDTGSIYDISNKHRLGYSEVELVQTMIDGVNTLWQKSQESESVKGQYRIL